MASFLLFNTSSLYHTFNTISTNSGKNHIFKLLYHPIENVKSISQEQFERICKEYPCFEKIHSIIWEFKGILTGKIVDALDKWIEKAKKLDIPKNRQFYMWT